VAASTTTSLYRAIVLALELRRLELGWPCWRLDDMAGTQDGYWMKLLYSAAPSGRVGGWQMLQLLVDALFPDGVGVRLTGEPISSDEILRQKIKAAVAKRDRRRKRIPPELRRTHLREYASAKEARTA
jgi:hypothetical protein